MATPDFKSFIRTLTSRPGVYRMYAADGKLIYVGKAKNLKNRVSSYFRDSVDSAKTRALIANTTNMEVTVTGSEAEALLLESNLIKEYRPRYNIVFRDDKSYPSLYLSDKHAFPRLSFYRGRQTGAGQYFGPYPNAGVARRTLNLVQKLFRLRQCSDPFFNNRTRPCLQYQIKRCSAPCVAFISQRDYTNDVELASLFLQGKNDKVLEALSGPMQQAADNLEFEKAAHYRDQIATLRRYQQSQHIIADTGETDIIACAIEADQACVQIFYIRSGRNLGNKSYYPKTRMGEGAAEIIETFIKQYYLGNPDAEIPATIFVSHPPRDLDLLIEVLGNQREQPVQILDKGRGEKGKWLGMARDNAALTLKQRLAQHLKYQDRFEQLRVFLGLEGPLNRIECFDISHTSGVVTVASCVVFGTEGAAKQDYRRFNIEGITRADDYAAMDQAITRHFVRVQQEQGKMPDLLLIDGGKGQISQVREALSKLQLDIEPVLLGIAKGPGRKPGLETLILSEGMREVKLDPGSAVLHLLQEIRDEAHRFAITGHRQRRKKLQSHSTLEDIEGIGARRRQLLIQHFGGIQGVRRAGPEELAKVAGINKNLAQKIYDTLHS
jgi:excinuclease ABC subunit C